MTTLFDSRLRDQLLDGLEPHRRRRRRRDRAMIGATAVALVVATGLGLAASDDDDGATELTDTRPVPATTTAPVTPTDPGPVVLPDVPLPEGPELRLSPSPTEAVTGMLAALRAEDTTTAAAYWTGYPGVDVVDGKVALLDALVAAAPWLLDARATTTEVDGFAFPGSDPPKIVTVTASTPEGPRAMAFVAGREQDATGWVVGRIPTEPYEVPATPVSGSPIAPGTTVTFLTVPSEGGARAYVDGLEVRVVTDLDAMEVRLTIPSDATGEITVTVAIATPELADAQAATYTVG